MKIRNFVCISVLAITASCSRDESPQHQLTENLMVGNWKLKSFEYKGKSFPAKSCEMQNSIKVNQDMRGSYDKFIQTSSGCTHPLAPAGTWTNTSDNYLILKYAENGTAKQISLQVESVSSNELRILSTDYDVDSNGSTDESEMIYVKQ